MFSCADTALSFPWWAQPSRNSPNPVSAPVGPRMRWPDRLHLVDGHPLLFLTARQPSLVAQQTVATLRALRRRRESLGVEPGVKELVEFMAGSVFSHIYEIGGRCIASFMARQEFADSLEEILVAYFLPRGMNHQRAPLIDPGEGGFGKRFPRRAHFVRPHLVPEVVEGLTVVSVCASQPL